MLLSQQEKFLKEDQYTFHERPLYTFTDSLPGGFTIDVALQVTGLFVSSILTIDTIEFQPAPMLIAPETSPFFNWYHLAINLLGLSRAGMISCGSTVGQDPTREQSRHHPYHDLYTSYFYCCEYRCHRYCTLHPSVASKTHRSHPRCGHTPQLSMSGALHDCAPVRTVPTLP